MVTNRKRVLILALPGGAVLALALALVQTARIKQWVWFGGMLGEGIALFVLASLISFYAPWVFLILPVTLLIYGIVGSNAPASKVA